MDGPPAQTLGAEGPEKNIMKRKAENGDIITKKDLLRIFISGLVMAVGTLLVFGYELNSNSGLGYNAAVTKAMTVAFSLFVIYQLFSAITNRANSEEKNKAFIYHLVNACI